MTYPYGFTHRKPIKAAASGIPASTLTSYRKLLAISGDSAVGAVTTSQKFAVVAADGTTLLPHGVVKFSNTLGSVDLILRYKQTQLSSWTNGQTIAYLLYGDDGTDQDDKPGVLDSSATGYWPLDEDPSGSAPQALDWSSNANHLTSNGSMTSGDLVSALVNKGIDFDPNDTLTTAALVGGSTSPITISLSVKPVSVNSDQNLFGIGTALANSITVLLGVDNGFYNIFRNGYPTGSAADTQIAASGAGIWDRLVYQSDGSTVRGFLNGALVVSVSGTLSRGVPTDLTLARGIGSQGSNHLVGILDEVFVDSAYRHADWIALDAAEIAAPSSTFTLGAEEVFEEEVSGPFLWEALDSFAPGIEAASDFAPGFEQSDQYTGADP